MPEAPPSDSPDVLSLKAHRLVIGTLGFLMPALIFVLAGARPTPGLPRWEPQWSISAYYYTGAIGVFVGVLFALSLFLFTYQGYKGVKADRVVGFVGGLAALFVGLFPTAAPAGLSPPPWWGDSTAVVHYVAAVVLFISFIVFALWLFRRSDKPTRRERDWDKNVRDDICLVCGLIMSGCVVWAAIAKRAVRPIFVPESIAIMAFATSWLAKGEAFTSIIRRVGKLMGRLGP
jgi:heme/copper-type cytochrome/quinol oxidase subunit 2